MTPTDPAAVEAMIKELNNEFRNMDGPEAAAMLTALVSERDDLHDKVGKLSRDNTTLADIADNAEAEAAALREALRAIVFYETSDYPERGDDICEHYFPLKEIASAALGNERDGNGR